MTQRLPITFEECLGLVGFAKGDTGVLFLNAWGFDELCSRKFLARLADLCCEAGFPTLRFDYPGTVDSLDPDTGSGLAAFRTAADQAIEQLKARTGCEKVVVAGFGLGACLAVQRANDREDILGTVLLAPVTNGRKYLRELKFRDKMIHEALRPDPDPSPSGVSIGGLDMSGELAAEINKIRLGDIPLPAQKPCLVLPQPDNTDQLAFAEHLKQAARDVQVLPFDGYQQLMENPTVSIIPPAVLTAIRDWLQETFPAGETEAPAARDPLPSNEDLAGPGFREKGWLFGNSNELYGVLCRPTGQAQRPVFVLLNAGYDHHGGWARSTVETARRLAGHGFPSFRFDMSNVGDSRARPEAPEEVLYTDTQIQDARTAIDFVQSHFPAAPIVLVGRCSGAYTALHVTACDDRVRVAFLVNQLVLIWDTDNDIAELNRSAPRPLDEYRDRVLSFKLLSRLMRGDVDVAGALRGLAGRFAEQAERHLLAKFRPGSKLSRFKADFRALYRKISAREVQLHFICSEKDQSLRELDYYLGLKKLSGGTYRNASLHLIANADHNLTPRAARQLLASTLIAETEKMVAEDRFHQT